MLHVKINLNTKYLRYNDTQWYNNKIILRSSLYLITTTNQRYSLQLLSIINNASLRRINKIYPTETSFSPPKKPRVLSRPTSTHPKGCKVPKKQMIMKRGWFQRSLSTIIAAGYRHDPRRVSKLGGNPLNRRLQRENETRTGHGVGKDPAVPSPVVINANGGCGRNKESRLLENFFHPSNQILGYHWKLGCSIKADCRTLEKWNFRKDFWAIFVDESRYIF